MAAIRAGTELFNHTSNLRGGIKKTVFFYFLSNRGEGGLGEYKKSLSENTKTFLTQGGGLGEYKKTLSENTKTFFD